MPELTRIEVDEIAAASQRDIDDGCGSDGDREVIALCDTLIAAWERERVLREEPPEWLTDKEKSVLLELAATKDLPWPRVLVGALRLYQLVDVAKECGYEMRLLNQQAEEFMRIPKVAEDGNADST